MCIVPLSLENDQSASPTCAAHRLDPQQRQQIALDALAGQPISQLAQTHQVSRKFVYQQLHKAHEALDKAFAQTPDEHQPVLFYLPVTRPWLQQLVLSLTLTCHSPLRGVCELLRDVFDFHLSLGGAHRILQQVIASAESIDQNLDLSAVRFGAHDEIFPSGHPVLAGVDVYSTYCYLLSQEEQRDGDTWGIRLLELRDKGFDPDATIADFGTGLRKGQQLALPDTPCRGDIFHPLRDLQTLVGHLENRAYQAIERLDGLQHQQARFQWRHGRKDRQLVKPTTAAKGEVEQAVALAEDVSTLLWWLRQDILAVAGPEQATRKMLYDWVVSELQQREGSCPRIGPVRGMLENQRDALLDFAAELDDELRNLADGLEVPVAVAREALAVVQMGDAVGGKGRREERLRRQLGGKDAVLRIAVETLAARVVRASSVIENINSRLRSYFFLRKQAGPEYLKLLKFCLNHRRFDRSEHPQREGKSPRELLTGQEHPHWLELLGYQRFRRP